MEIDAAGVAYGDGNKPDQHSTCLDYSICYIYNIYILYQ